MKKDNGFDRAGVLIEALPYIQAYNKKTVVIKYGGNAMINEDLKKAVISDIVLLSLVGVRVVLVHGGGPEISAMLKKTGKESVFVNGLRYTDAETMEIVQMVLCGKLNKDIVSLVCRAGGSAVGFCGLDGGMIRAKRLLDNGEDYGLVGEIVEISPEVITNALDSGQIPVVSSVAMGVDEETSYNINADTAAAKIATALGAEKLILLTDVRGLLGDAKDEKTLIPLVRLSDVPGLIKDGVITGGMIPKIDCCVEALRRGVKRATILDGRVEHSILMELFSDEGVGTMIIQ